MLTLQLVRLQRGYGSDFVKAPSGLNSLIVGVNGAKLATLAFVDGDTSSAGLVLGCLWTSSLISTIETAQFIPHPIISVPDGNRDANCSRVKKDEQMQGRQFRNIDEVYAGEFDGMTEEQIKQIAPEVVLDRKQDKIGFRYPRGESYYDIIARLEPVMSYLERIRDPILLISHQAVLRLIYSWLSGTPREQAMEVLIPQHEIIQMRFDGLGGRRVETRHPLGPTKLVDDGQGNL